MQVTSLNQNLVSPIISMQNANRPLYLLKESLHKAAAFGELETFFKNNPYYSKP